MLIRDQHVTVGRGDIDVTGAHLLAIDRVRRLTVVETVEKRRQDAAPRSDMLHNENWLFKAARQPGNERPQGFHATLGGSDGDNTGHSRLRLFSH